ncbi:serine hydrolase domain-containing protein [Pontibacter sp. G13]|uniref:serine hydrolase domain-containing protein n=1 Tax=Pontibacter sp. G13 TaxID=3074898 RepID=UPI00288A2527|nr:serine hydrolase domain-containing protein [Pontibacter sp. G13]WNJ19704.1 serine hydrolase domain-containing protein [Pontibacter sp. G13]
MMMMTDAFPTWARWIPLCFMGIMSACQSVEPPQSLSALHEQLVSTADIPAVAMLVVEADSIHYLSAQGVRFLDSEDSIALDDPFHLGSNTKAMTALGIAKWLDQAPQGWNTPLQALMAGTGLEILPPYQGITMADLLSHRAGIAPFTDLMAFDTLPKWSGSVRDRRLAFTEWLVHQPPGPQGEYDYSNSGYTVAATILEQHTGLSWEEWMQDSVFEPLGIQAGFGWPMDHLENPILGHYSGEMGMPPIAHTPEMSYRVSPLIASAGDIMISAPEWAKLLQEFLRGHRGESTFLGQEQWKYLLESRPTYSMGWRREVENGIEIFHHAGTAGTFYTTAVIIPDRNIAFAIMTSAGPDFAGDPILSIKQVLTDRYTR